MPFGQHKEENLSYRTIVKRRLVIFFRARGHAREIDNKTVLGPGDNGFGFDAENLRDAIRPALNGNKAGFADVLKSSLVRNEVTVATEFQALVGSLVERSKKTVNTPSKYAAVMRGRVEQRVDELIAEAGGHPDPDDIDPQERLDSYLNAQQTANFVEAARARLQKFLLLGLDSTVVRGNPKVRVLADRIHDLTVI